MNQYQNNGYQGASVRQLLFAVGVAFVVTVLPFALFIGFVTWIDYDTYKDKLYYVPEAHLYIKTSSIREWGRQPQLLKVSIGKKIEQLDSNTIFAKLNYKSYSDIFNDVGMLCYYNPINPNDGRDFLVFSRKDEIMSIDLKDFRYGFRYGLLRYSRRNSPNNTESVEFTDTVGAELKSLGLINGQEKWCYIQVGVNEYFAQSMNGKELRMVELNPKDYKNHVRE